MRLGEAVKLGEEMLGRDECHSDTFYRVFSPDYRKALGALIKAVQRRKK